MGCYHFSIGIQGTLTSPLLARAARMLLQQHRRLHSFDQERELLSRVEAAREQIEQEGTPVTQAALVELVRVSSKVLRKFSRIRTLLDEVVLRSRRQRLAQRSAREVEYLAKLRPPPLS